MTGLTIKVFNKDIKSKGKFFETIMLRKNRDFLIVQQFFFTHK